MDSCLFCPVRCCMNRNHEYKPYIIAGLVSLFLMILFFLMDQQLLFWIKKLMNHEFDYMQYKRLYLGTDDPSVPFTEWDFLRFTVFNFPAMGFDTKIIFSTQLFQLFIPLYGVLAGICFYRERRTVYRFEYFRNCRYRRMIFLKAVKHSVCAALSVFVPYMLFVIFMRIATGADPRWFGCMSRTLFDDVLPEGFYLRHIFAYYVLEGSVRFFLIPSVYAVFSEAAVLISPGFKTAAAAPVLYYYGLSAIGFALYWIIPQVSLYVNPSVIMAAGSYSDINTPLIIAINMIPMFIGIMTILKQTEYAEI